MNKVKDRADERINTMSSTASPETQKKLTGFMNKVKEGAQKAEEELKKAKQEFDKKASALDQNGKDGGGGGDANSRPGSLHLEINLTLEIGQLLLSLLHAWGLDKELDRVATIKLGLLRPRVPVSFGVLSKGGVMALPLPTWYPRPPAGQPPLPELKPTHIPSGLSSVELARETGMNTFSTFLVFPERIARPRYSTRISWSSLETKLFEYSTMVATTFKCTFCLKRSQSRWEVGWLKFEEL